MNHCNCVLSCRTSAPVLSGYLGEKAGVELRSKLQARLNQSMALASPQNLQEAAAKHTMAEHSHQSWRSPPWEVPLGPPWAWRLGVPRGSATWASQRPGGSGALAPGRSPVATPRGGALAVPPWRLLPRGSGAPLVPRPHPSSGPPVLARGG